MNIGSPERRIKSLEQSLLPNTIEDELREYFDVLERDLEEDILNEKNRDPETRKES
ncbi:hypothetical protein [Carnobacterium inhibens]|uniref:Uncharacterized protein n=1 Tax=Carnobacterium inhibens TaxID=147709 RepID=A0ABR7TGT3_9LACT|nr:hypothetical protein [Carnobacterium inhibens]MBC9826433.1 hypothetical protein [Carnobacterium inhibens]